MTKHETPTHRAGEAVRWNTSQGETHGKVVRKLTGTTHVKGHTVKATPQAPEYLVRSDKTGAEAAHKPEQLKPARARK